MKKLLKKLFRDIRKSLGQFIAITIVSAIGVMLLTGMAAVHMGLLNTTDSYYQKSNLADLSAYFLGIDDNGIGKIKKISGVEDVYGRLSLQAVSTENKSAFFVHSVSNDEKINIPVLDSGHIPQSDNECMIDEAYATKNNLKNGDQISAVINQKNYDFTISGLFNSAEYVYLVEDPSKSMMPDHKNFGLLYINKSLIGNINGSATYNEVLVTLHENADAGIVSKEIESITNSYGLGHITFQKDQLSYTQLQSDIISIDAFSKLFPYIFFLVAAVIIFISMSRTVQSERNQIGVMKALGISSRSIMMHYMGYSIISGLIGSVLGNLLGILILPQIMFETYKILYTLPEITQSGVWMYIVMSVAAVLFFGISASLLSARKTLKEMPAQCMRPLPPKKVHKTWLEKREKLWSRLSYKNKLIFRNIFLNKWRAILSSVGVIGCVGLLMCGFGMKSATKSFVDIQFNQIQKFDSMVMLSLPVDYTKPTPFRSTNIKTADKMSVIGVTLSAKEKVNSVLYVLPENNNSIQLFDNHDNRISLPSDGIVVPYKLAQKNNIKIGDTIPLKLESPLYKNISINVRVAAIDVLYVSQDLYVSYQYLKKFDINPYTNGYYVTMKNSAAASSTNNYLSSVKNVNSVTVKSKLKEQLDSVFQIMDTILYILIIMSACLALAVIFNISSINIFERRRDIATLKVLGYHRNEINSLVYIENLIITAFGCFIGVFFGSAIYGEMIKSMVSEDMYLPSKITLSMVAISIILSFVFTLFANFMLRAKIRNIDMVESLKSVE